MRTQTRVRSKAVLRHRPDAFEKVLPELTLIELRHLLETLHRKDDTSSRHRLDKVRREIDGRRFVYLQPSVVMP